MWYNFLMFGSVFQNLHAGESDAVGLDISDETFKFVQLKKGRHGFALAAFGEGDFPKELIVSGEVKQEAEVVKILKDAFARPLYGKLTARHIVCSLPEEHSFTRVIQLPKMSMSEAKEAIKWEIEQSIPMGINDVYYDWQLVEMEQQGVGHQDVLISAAPRKIVDGYVSVIKKCGFIPRALEVESVAVSRSLVKDLKTDAPVLLVDIGATRTSFIIFSGTALQFTSSVPVAGNKMIAAISSVCTVKEEEAKKLFYDIGLDKNQQEGKVYAALEPIASDLANQIRSYVAFYESHAMHEHRKEGSVAVAKILLCGGASNLNGLNVYLGLALKIPVETGNPWTNILKEPLKEVPELSYRRSLGYTTVLGLALSGIQKSDL
ncbi:MAG: type IV pilus assembly protein PilM [Candidatus Azambacteria bacterium]|nr:type IV pilus assembly protein PilM [Candidatus Azambacteria bacterium]